MAEEEGEEAADAAPALVKLLCQHRLRGQAGCCRVWTDVTGHWNAIAVPSDVPRAPYVIFGVGAGVQMLKERLGNRLLDLVSFRKYGCQPAGLLFAPGASKASRI